MPDRTIDIGYVHVGKYRWKRGTGAAFECADNCPHPSHRATSPSEGTEQNADPESDSLGAVHLESSP